MVTIVGPNKSKYFTRIGVKATQSNTKCRLSPTEREAQYEQRRRRLGTPDRLPRIIGKEWQPILNRKKTLIHRELIGNCKSDFGRRTPEGLANYRRYVHKVAFWLGHVRGQMSKVPNSWAVGASNS